MTQASPSSNNQHKHHWANIGEAGALTGLKFMLWVYSVFGRLPFKLLLYPVVLYFMLFKRTATRASQQYLRYLQQANRYQPTRHPLLESYRHFMSFSECILDKLLAWQGQIERSALDLYGFEHIEQLAEQGRGAVLFGSHLGNLEICRALAHQRQKITLNVLMHTANAVKFNQLLRQVGSGSHVNIIQVTEVTPATAMMLSEKIEQGEFIVIAADRVPVTQGNNTASVEFLGHACPLPVGPFILASLLHCPVLTVFCLRQQNSAQPNSAQPRWDLRVSPFAERIILPRKQRPQALQAYCQQWADILSQHCQLAPHQWYNFYPFWHDNSDADQSLSEERQERP